MIRRGYVLDIIDKLISNIEELLACLKKLLMRIVTQKGIGELFSLMHVLILEFENLKKFNSDHALLLSHDCQPPNFLDTLFSSNCLSNLCLYLAGLSLIEV
jgi:hypothetical protein